MRGEDIVVLCVTCSRGKVKRVYSDTLYCQGSHSTNSVGNSCNKKEKVLLGLPWPDIIGKTMKLVWLSNTDPMEVKCKHGPLITRNKANLRDLIAATGLVILLKLDSNSRFFSPYEIEIWWMTSQNYGAPLLHYIKLCASSQTPR